MRDITYEPDHPNFTPRISASCHWQRPPYENEAVVEMSLLRKSPWSVKCDRHFYEINGLEPGFGHCLTTYVRNDDPLPAFRGEPFLLPLLGDIQWIISVFEQTLDPDNLVSLAVKFTPRNESSNAVIINKYEKVG